MFLNVTDRSPGEMATDVDFFEDSRSSDSENYSASIVEELKSEDPTRRDPLYVVIPITIIYIAIFSTGLVGNVSTCVVIARNKSMHTATNYYLFSLAISDLLLLVSGMPQEMWTIWSQFPYVFGEIFCAIQSFAAETSANATVLTITAFTVERYVAICHPFRSHTMSKLSRAVKFVVAIWLFALGLAIPQAIQFGIVYSEHENGTVIDDTARCTVKQILLHHAFEISTMLFFVVPMTIITVLYVLIAVKLRRSRLLTCVKRTSMSGSVNHHADSGKSKTAAQRNVIRMLVAVVVAFFICWAPFHAQRLLAVYAKGLNGDTHPAIVIVYTILTYVSGIFYYLSTTVNPLLYNIMSNKFREAFKSMLSQHCGRRRSQWKSSPRRPTYSALSHRGKSEGRLKFESNHRQSASASGSEEPGEAQRRDRRAIAVERVSSSPSDKNLPPIDLGDEEIAMDDKLATEIRSASSVVPDFNRSVSGGSSNSSQLTVSTFVGKRVSEGNNNVPFHRDARIDERNSFPKKKRSPLPGDARRSHRTIVLGILAERIRLGTKGIFSPESKGKPGSGPKVRPEIASAPPRLRSDTSVDSANTISNSSLQDLDETEFTGSELARYMGEVNVDLVT